MNRHCTRLLAFTSSHTSSCGDHHIKIYQDPDKNSVAMTLCSGPVAGKSTSKVNIGCQETGGFKKLNFLLLSRNIEF